MSGKECVENSKSDALIILRILFIIKFSQILKQGMFLTPSNECVMLCVHLLLVASEVHCRYFKLILQTLIRNGT